MVVCHVEKILREGVVVVILIPGRMGRSELDVGENQGLGRYCCRCCRFRADRAGHEPGRLDLSKRLPQGLGYGVHS
jgi:hypothetical protein